MVAKNSKGSSLTEFVVIFPFMFVIIMFFVGGMLILSEKYLLKYVVYLEARKFLVDNDVTESDIEHNILRKLDLLPYNKSVRKLELIENEKSKGLRVLIHYKWPIVDFKWAHFSFEEYCAFER